MTHATIDDVKKRISRELSESEEALCEALLDDASGLIDAYAPNASETNKKIVACHMVVRAIGTGEASLIPAGATQGSMSALGYTQSWTISNGEIGELYLTKRDRKLLGIGDALGSHSPLEDLSDD